MKRLAIMLATCASAPVMAQSAGSIPPPPVRQTIDDNGVDVLRGQFLTGETNVIIGAGSGGLSFRSFAYNAQWSNDEVATIDQVGTGVTVTIDGKSDGFNVVAGAYQSSEGNGATLVVSGAYYIYTSRNGTVASFVGNSGQLFGFWRASLGRISEITRPNGYKENYLYTEEDYCGSGWEGGDCPSGVKQAWRLLQVTNTNGYKLSFAYAYSGSNLTLATIRDWSRITGVTASNTVVTGAGSSATATFSTTADGSGNVTRTATDPLSRTTTYYKGVGYGQMTIKRPGASSPNVTVTYDSTTNAVTNVTREGVSYAYGYADSVSTRTTTVTAPDSSTRIYVGDTTTNLLASYRDELNRLTAYTYDSSGRVTQITMPEGNKVQYSYDARGNVTETRAISKASGTPADVVTTTAYPSSCTNVVICNKPTSATDARGNTTDYSYDATYGGLLSVTAPAPTSGAVRPQTRYGYTATSGVTLLTSVSSCQTTASCTGTADEVRSVISYGTNLLPVGTTSGAGDGSLTATVAATYDAIGNRTYVDGPLSGTADTTRTLYDAARQVVGVIGPDPDGGGAMLNRAVRLTYNSDGQVTLAEKGTTAGQSDSNWASFSPIQSNSSIYDASARKTSDKLLYGSTSMSLSQYSYDARGRPECAATRMNTSVYGSPPSTACTLGTAGSFGDDRITKTVYDAASQVTKVQTAYATADVADEAAFTYNANGTTATLTDGEGNKTAYEYDGYDRVAKTRFPSPTTPGTSSTTDYEAPTYDAGSNVTAVRLRDASSIAFTYDALNRVTAKDVPSGVSGEYDASYSYDLLSRLSYINDSTNTPINFTHDALGRTVSEAYNGVVKTMQYDLAGRMTRLSWPDGLYAQYDHLVTGEVSMIRENGASSGAGVLGLYTYDNLGRRTGVTRGNGVVTSYSYTSSPWLTNLSHDANGSSNDVAWSYSYNPAGQIASSTRDNDAYAFSALANQDVAESPNGLNQLTTQGATTLTYDGRGNASAVGSTTYGYTSENRLTTAQPSNAGGITQLYDIGGRLFQLTQGANVTRFDHVGAQLLTEMSDANATLRRYVPGPGTDEVLTWYEGSGTSDRRWLITDERGSTVGITNGSGVVTDKLAYDVYGTPQGSSSVRFKYTGQAWLSELGMHYYKARVYAPTLGRFMQSDPIGYSAGVNMYTYVGGDPVNATDPSGMVPLPSKPENPLPTCPEANGCGSDIIVTGTRSCGSFCSSITDPIAIQAVVIQFGPVPNFSASADRAGAGQLPQRTNPPKPLPQKTTVNCAIVAGVTAGSVAAAGGEAITVGIAAFRGARIGALVGELGSPLGAIVGGVIGGAVGVAVYYYNAGDKFPADALKGCPQ